MTSNRLADFAKPPVTEVVLGGQFNPLAGFTNGHLGAFWRSLEGNWPKTDDAPALPPEFERFGKEQQMVQLGLVRLSLTNTPASRLRIWNADEDRMVQIQNGRLHFNWLGGHGREYVRYPTIKREFAAVFDQFRAFVAREGLRDLRLNQWEITYVNQIPRGTVWSGPGDWSRVFASSVCLPHKLHGAAMESFGGEWHYEIEPQRGRLHVQLEHGWQDPPGVPERKELLIFKLTARGPVSERVEASLEEGLDLGHSTIVTAFRDVAAKEAREFWEEQR